MSEDTVTHIVAFDPPLTEAQSAVVDHLANLAYWGGRMEECVHIYQSLLNTIREASELDDIDEVEKDSAIGALGSIASGLYDRVESIYSTVNDMRAEDAEGGDES